jgi:hypothetical protein
MRSRSYNNKKEMRNSASVFCEVPLFFSLGLNLVRVVFDLRSTSGDAVFFFFLRCTFLTIEL